MGEGNRCRRIAKGGSTGNKLLVEVPVIRDTKGHVFYGQCRMLSIRNTQKTIHSDTAQFCWIFGPEYVECDNKIPSPITVSKDVMIIEHIRFAEGIRKYTNVERSFPVLTGLKEGASPSSKNGFTPTKWKIGGMVYDDYVEANKAWHRAGATYSFESYAIQLKVKYNPSISFNYDDYVKSSGSYAGSGSERISGWIEFYFDISKSAYGDHNEKVLTTYSLVDVKKGGLNIDAILTPTIKSETTTYVDEINVDDEDFPTGVDVP